MTSRGFLEHTTKPNSGDPVLALVVIAHASLPAPMRFVNNRTNIVSRGDTYTAFGFEFTPPSVSDNNQRPATIRFDNVTDEIGRKLEVLDDGPTVTVEVIKGDAPDDVEIEYPTYDVLSVSWDMLEVTASLKSDLGLDEPVMPFAFTIGDWPSLI